MCTRSASLVTEKLPFKWAEAAEQSPSPGGRPSALIGWAGREREGGRGGGRKCHKEEDWSEVGVGGFGGREGGGVRAGTQCGLQSKANDRSSRNIISRRLITRRLAAAPRANVRKIKASTRMMTMMTAVTTMMGCLIDY